MNIYNFDVNFTTGRIYAPDFILVVNDNNSTLFKFTFDQTGRYVFKLLYPDGTIYVQDIIDNQLKLTKGVLNQEGNYKFEISLYGDDNRLTTARIKEFPVRLELVSTDEPVQADDRLPILDNLIEETNKIVEAAKNGDYDGATFTPSVSDTGDLSWTNDKGKENPPTVNIAGPPGAPGAVKMQVVDTLPDVGETDTIYLLKKDVPGEQNLYDEYVYTETTGWEHIGDTSVDLTDYYTKEETDKKLDNKQDTLTAGNNITIENNIISASGGDDNTPIVYNWLSTTTGNLSGDAKIFFTNIYEKALNTQQPIFLNKYTSSDDSINPNGLYYLKSVSDTQLIFKYVYGNFQFGGRCAYNSKYHTVTQTYYNPQITIAISNGEATTYTTNSTIQTPLNIGLLTLNNTIAYTPTADYHPATKKYTDDTVASAEGTIVYYWKGNSTEAICNDFKELAMKVANENKKVIIYYTGTSWQRIGAYYINVGHTAYIMNSVGINNAGLLQSLSCRLASGELVTISRTYNPYISCVVTAAGDILSVSFDMGSSTKQNYGTPTADTDAANKKYVDDTIDSAYQRISGYDSTKTQVLKNVNGTLQWINNG